MLKSLKVAAALAVLGIPAFADGYGLGREALPEEIAAWDIDVRPDGQGLPEGRGNAFDGEEVFADKCASCHGDFGEAVGRWPVLAGGHDTLTDDRPVKTIGSYWPYTSTVWDYINRAMPFGDAQSLTPDEVYAITAYLLYVNDLVEDDFELSHENFASVKLPNEPNFFMDDRAETELAAFSGDVCMSNCKDSVEITARAAIIDVTPEETEAKKAEEAKAQETAAAADPEPEAQEEAPAAPAEPDPELVAKGKKVFKKCKACHQVGDKAKNRSGPLLNGIIGAPAAAVEGFKYSKAMKKAADGGLIWTDETLGEFLKKPKAYIKGTKMGFSGLKKDKDRAAIAAYLSTFK